MNSRFNGEVPRRTICSLGPSRGLPHNCRTLVRRIENLCCVLSFQFFFLFFNSNKFFIFLIWRTFHYNSQLCSDRIGYNLAGGKAGFYTQETKFPSFGGTLIQDLCWNEDQATDQFSCHQQAGQPFVLADK